MRKQLIVATLIGGLFLSFAGTAIGATVQAPAFQPGTVIATPTKNVNSAWKVAYQRLKVGKAFLRQHLVRL